ncbi:hypothetical protein BMT54_01760 [Pasteurellaceae bacterium 15-036681]|nr:hypothetical protein BMT54_01760 [Pasteurellaceae bacterium 15-036681]
MLMPLDVTNIGHESFEAINRNGTIEIEVQVSKQTGNRAQRLGDGIFVPPTDNHVDVHTITMASGASAWASASDIGRRNLTVSGVLGILHIDFQLSSAISSTGSQVIANLPNDAPTPTTLVEVQIGTGTVFIEANSRQIKAQNLARSTRYIVHFAGFFQ